MILNKKDAKKLGIKETLNLREIILNNEGYYKISKSKWEDIKLWGLYLLAGLGIVTLINLFAGVVVANADNRDVIRESRIEACQQAYNEYEEWIEERYIHTSQDWVARCFAYSSLVFAKETGFGTSRMCIEDKNCHGLKQMTYDIKIPYTVGNNRFVIFNSPDDSNLAFARLFARFHMNKNADVFVRGVWVNGQRVGAYSQTDQYTYVMFIQDNFWAFYEIGKDLQNK